MESTTQAAPVQATFRYLVPTDRLDPPVPPFRHAEEAPPGEFQSNEATEPHVFPVHDIRQDLSNFGLDISGFEALIDAPTSFDRWDEDAVVAKEYYDEVIRLLKDRLGATRVVIFDHTVRRRAPERDLEEDTPGKRQPVFRVHIDQTQRSGVARIKSHLPPSDVPALLKTRAQIVNVWRPLRGPVRDSPIGLIDARSVDWEKDAVIERLIYPNREGEILMLHYNPQHRWNYLAEMQKDEVLLIKCFDNLLPYAVAPHTGFAFDTVPPGTLPRQSIEVRCLVFYEDQPIPV